jgi:hypothetical protein
MMAEGHISAGDTLKLIPHFKGNKSEVLAGRKVTIFMILPRENLNRCNVQRNCYLILLKTKHSKRHVRGAFNFIGEVSKILFGTMDEDAQYYNEQIRHFEETS